MKALIIVSNVRNLAGDLLIPAGQIIGRNTVLALHENHAVKALDTHRGLVNISTDELAKRMGGYIGNAYARQLLKVNEKPTVRGTHVDVIG